MVWEEIEGDAWSIPKERSKNTLANVVPLMKEVRDLLGHKQNGGFVFSNEIDRRRAFSGFSKAKAALDQKIADLRKREGRAPMPHWVHHDLRRTGRSLMSRASVLPDVAERVLGHIIPGVRGTYDRYEYLDEKRDALEKLAALIEHICTQSTQSCRSPSSPSEDRMRVRRARQRPPDRIACAYREAGPHA
jgi:integrase